MTDTSATPRLTSLSHGAGCACKLSLDELLGLLGDVGSDAHPDLLVGFRTGDDAAVWRRDDGRSLVATTDFFAPLVDDPRLWGRIAAANAVSDVYAMGGSPLFALNVVGWPRALSFEVLRDVLAGADETAEQAGYVVVGGHSVDSAEPLYGQAVIGEVAGRPLTNSGADPGDVLVLTKAIGTGIITTAAKRGDPTAIHAGGSLVDSYTAAARSMTRLNDAGARVARQVEASAVTDVTGFGLLGHLHRMALASGVAATIAWPDVPLLPGVPDLCRDGLVPGGTRRNAEQAGRYLMGDPVEEVRTILADAQTSGGLLIACSEAAAPTALDALEADGHEAAVVGCLVEGPAGQVRVTG